MKWITRERPKVDRIACPWLIARYIDTNAEFLFVPASDVHRIAAETGAIPFDVEGVELSHVGPLCSFDAFLSKYALDRNPALIRMARIVRGADTARLDLAPVRRRSRATTPRLPGIRRIARLAGAGARRDAPVESAGWRADGDRLTP